MALAAELTAGDVDDNLNFDFYQGWADRTRAAYPTLPALTLTDRVTLVITNESGVPVPGALVELRSRADANWSLNGNAGSDGVFRFFPAFDGAGNATLFDVEAAAPDGSGTRAAIELKLSALPKDRTVRLDVKGASTQPPSALDLMLVLDTTGSMKDELGYLKAELAAIVVNITADYPALDVHYGAVAYRDLQDDYVVKSFPFTGSLVNMTAWLANQSAHGGGDTPEAMELGLQAALNASWRPGNVARVMLVVADAPPHDNNMGEAFRLVEDARRAGVHIQSMAASGTDQKAEYVLRAAATLTLGRYLFLTDDSGLGNGHAEPHIQCYQVTLLSNLLGRVIAAQLSGERVEAAASDVARQVGNISHGVCIDDKAEVTAGPTLPMVVEPRAASTPTPSAPTTGTAGPGAPGTGAVPAGVSSVRVTVATAAPTGTAGSPSHASFEVDMDDVYAYDGGVSTSPAFSRMAPLDGASSHAPSMAFTGNATAMTPAPSTPATPDVTGPPRPTYAPGHEPQSAEASGAGSSVGAGASNASWPSIGAAAILAAGCAAAFGTGARRRRHL